MGVHRNDLNESGIQLPNQRYRKRDRYIVLAVHIVHDQTGLHNELIANWSVVKSYKRNVSLINSNDTDRVVIKYRYRYHLNPNFICIETVLFIFIAVIIVVDIVSV